MLPALIYPMAAQVLLTAIVLLLMIFVRIRALRSGEVKIKYFVTYDSPAPEMVIKTSRHFTNLFELPVLFFVSILTFLVLNIESTTITILAWLFVVARVVHAITHIGLKNIYARMLSYIVAWLSVLAMWGVLLTY